MKLKAAFRLAFLVAIAGTTFLALTDEALPGVFYIWDKGNHAVAFLVLSFLLDFSYPVSAVPYHSTNLAKAGLLLAYAVSIEAAQWYVGYRSVEAADIVAGIVGMVAYACLMPATNKLRILREMRCPTSQSL